MDKNVIESIEDGKNVIVEYSCLYLNLNAETRKHINEIRTQEIQFCKNIHGAHMHYVQLHIVSQCTDS